MDEMDKPEEMAAFFDARAAGYNEHMREYVFSDATFAQFYQALSAPIEKTFEPLSILILAVERAWRSRQYSSECPTR